jgi:site-specific DNA-methyltransferase (adenine-specific)
VLLLEKGHRDPNRRDLGDVLHIPRVVRGYPSEKPVGLWKILIGQSTHPGELVCDPFCGSGSVGVAARELGRRALLCDIDAATAAGRLRVAAASLEGAAA